MKPASKLKRFLAMLIDAVLATILGFAPVIGLALSFAYVLLKDGMNIQGFKGRSVGKWAMGLAVASADGAAPKQTLVDSLKRNILFVIPFMGLVEGIVVLVNPEGRRLGDRIAQTLVVEDAPAV